MGEAEITGVSTLNIGAPEPGRSGFSLSPASALPLPGLCPAPHLLGLTLPFPSLCNCESLNLLLK